MNLPYSTVADMSGRSFGSSDDDDGPQPVIHQCHTTLDFPRRVICSIQWNNRYCFHLGQCDIVYCRAQWSVFLAITFDQYAFSKKPSVCHILLVGTIAGWRKRTRIITLTRKTHIHTHGPTTVTLRSCAEG